jgi:hypothetical protein
MFYLKVISGFYCDSDTDDSDGKILPVGILMMEVTLFLILYYLPDYTSSYPQNSTSDEQRFSSYYFFFFGRVLMTIILNFDPKIPVPDLSVSIKPSYYATPV